MNYLIVLLLFSTQANATSSIESSELPWLFVLLGFYLLFTITLPIFAPKGRKLFSFFIALIGYPIMEIALMACLKGIFKLHPPYPDHLSIIFLIVIWCWIYSIIVKKKYGLAILH